jgi:L-alanine-DL-glutamate epimerase-like enolase superfamily enzyme
LKIASVDTYQLSLPYHALSGLQFIAGRPSNGLAMVLVRIVSDSGVIGWGEAFGHAGAAPVKAAVDTVVAPLVVGADASDIGALMETVRRRLHLFGLSGPIIYAASGVDIALWDLAGKAAGVPISAMLGGTPKELPVYASFLRCTNEEALEKCCLEAKKQGYRAVKLHEIEVGRIRLAREVLGPDIGLAVDTNCPWSRAEARSVADQIADLDILWLEEPLWPPDDFNGLAALRASGVSISAGENVSSLLDFTRLFESGAVDVAQPSVCKVGGITAMRKIAALAEGFAQTIVPHCGYMGAGYLANLHLVAAMPGGTMVERLFMNLEENPFPTMPQVRDGKTATPAGPGLGCEPDREIVERYRVT